MARRFNIHQTTVLRIISSWSETIDACFPEIYLWPTKEEVQKHLPTVFLNDYPNTRVLIDCAEIFIEKPKNPDSQSLIWPSYKNRNTLKFLLAVTPNGIPCFVLDCYGGRINTYEQTKKSVSGRMSKRVIQVRVVYTQITSGRIFRPLFC